MAILDGKKLSEELAIELEQKISKIGEKLSLVIIQVGNLAESSRYIKTKKVFGEKLGVRVIHEQYQSEVSSESGSQNGYTNSIYDQRQVRAVDGIRFFFFFRK